MYAHNNDTFVTTLPFETIVLLRFTLHDDRKYCDEKK